MAAEPRRRVTPCPVPVSVFCVGTDGTPTLRGPADPPAADAHPARVAEDEPREPGCIPGVRTTEHRGGGLVPARCLQWLPALPPSRR